MCLAGEDGRVDVAGVLDILAERACSEVLVEAGAGVGDGMEPPVYLAPGDVVRVGVEGLGAQRQTIQRPL